MQDNITNSLNWIYQHCACAKDFFEAAIEIGLGKTEIRKFLLDLGANKNDVDDLIYTYFPDSKYFEAQISCGNDSFIVTGISVPTLREIKKLPKYILANGSFWWTRSDKDTFAGAVYPNGHVHAGQINDPEFTYSLRPVLEIEAVNVSQKYFSFGGCDWYLISPEKLLCMSDIAQLKIQKDDKEWDSSATKEYLDRWYLKLLKTIKGKDFEMPKAEPENVATDNTKSENKARKAKQTKSEKEKVPKTEESANAEANKLPHKTPENIKIKPPETPKKSSNIHYAAMDVDIESCANRPYV